MSQKLLQVNNLTTSFRTADGLLPAVRDVSFHVNKGETLCIVGESGCGKSITSLSMMQLLPNNGEISQGEILFNGQDLTKLSQVEMRQIRGNDISMIFQEPMTALNPVFNVGFQLREPLRIHKKMSKKQAHNQGIKLLNQVGIPSPEKRMHQYPHELSGGMRQRVMIAIALACSPQLLIADEPTTALDVTIQSQILDLIDDLKKEFNMGVVLITHDMGVVAEVADRVMVMYAGEKIEEADAYSIFNHPQHPYTKGLLKSVPNVDDKEHNLEPIPGQLPSLKDRSDACPFVDRCEFAMEKCAIHSPPTFNPGVDHSVRCWLQEEDEYERNNSANIET
ncbi:peptide ABC transporter ATP-binding protein [Halalkalibacillus sediminis]|uniref:Peptide ABC transporter ATP-binding protein n=1 Tax=Halalkalibacillus sediminis TaxID=2018042 RepID=A0A2I0QS94_9BACI|nr:ABC transporter ATP-binding protein [Halalkalibacillus sediminis]PKR77179.1 peptide ABC transporter ATP-binding protein [Halalkalibacillus sediminis]